MEYCEKYCTPVKIELVCEDREAEKFISVIAEKVCTGEKGDGKIFASDISEAVSIRTGKKGSLAI